MLPLTLLVILSMVFCVRAEPKAFEVVSFEAAPNPNSSENELTKFRFTYQGREDYAIIEPTDSKTWVVFFHSFGGDALELYTSPLIHPLWIDTIRNSGFGLVSFQTYGNSWMSPFTADAVHLALDVIREKYQVKDFIFVGGSMGGSAVLTYCVRYPADVSAALAMCPVSDIKTQYDGIQDGLEPGISIKKAIESFYGETEATQKDGFLLSSVQQNADKLVMPLVIAHGGADGLILVSQSDTLADLLKDKADFKYFRYPDGDHFLPSVQGFKDSWPWLIEQIKPTNP